MHRVKPKYEKSRVKDENIAQINVNKMLYLLSKIIERSFFINPLILYWLKKNPHLKEVKTIQVHDLPLAKTLIWLNKNIISKIKQSLFSIYMRFGRTRYKIGILIKPAYLGSFIELYIVLVGGKNMKSCAIL